MSEKAVRKITEHECDYVICLKGNQETLHDDVRLYFETTQKEPNFYPLSKTSAKDHGCIEKREYFSTEDVDGIADKKGLDKSGIILYK